jgi:hypothetical protein
MTFGIRSFLVCALALVLGAGAAQAAEKKTLCIYDPSGGNGDIFNLMKDYKNAAVAWGVDFAMKPYTDEKTAAEDFKASKCDAVVLTSTRVRLFHKFAGTLEAMGGLTSYDQLAKIVTQFATPKGGALLKTPEYNILGLFPGGAVWLFVRDRSIDTVPELAGKRLATLDYDEAAKTMVRHVGASLVPADLGNFAGMFNNGNVDACYAPAVAFKALELYKGLGSKGGVARYILSQLTFQIVSRASTFTDDFANASRKWGADNFARYRAIVEKGDKDLPADKWIDIAPADKVKYDTMFQEVRIRIRDELKVYDKNMLTLMRRVRCQAEPARAECAEQKE